MQKLLKTQWTREQLKYLAIGLGIGFTLGLVTLFGLIEPGLSTNLQ